MRSPPRVGITARQIRNFVAVLIDQDRILLLPEIAKQLEIELNRRIGRVDALTSLVRVSLAPASAIR